MTLGSRECQQLWPCHSPVWLGKAKMEGKNKQPLARSPAEEFLVTVMFKTTFSRHHCSHWRQLNWGSKRQMWVIRPSVSGFKRKFFIFGLSVELFPSCVVATWSPFARQWEFWATKLLCSAVTVLFCPRAGCLSDVMAACLQLLSTEMMGERPVSDLAVNTNLILHCWAPDF